MFRTAARSLRFGAQSRGLATRTGVVQARSLTSAKRALAVGAVAATATFIANDSILASEKKVDYAAVRGAIADLLDDPSHDDGSFGPIFVRLAWHAAGTYDAATGTGGSASGASMRFPPESEWGANAGLHAARARLEQVKEKFPEISYADLWSLAGVVAVEEMGGPTIKWSPGRVDCTADAPALPDGRLPDATQGPPHLRDIFHRMGFNDKEIVALSGAHTLGRCHATSSGFVNPWTNAPTTFSNLYFLELLNTTWTHKKWSGPTQYEDPTGSLMMLPSDMALLDDPEFFKHVQAYAKDEKLFFGDFAAAFSKLLALGTAQKKAWYKLW